MTSQPFVYVAAPTVGEPSKFDVFKDGHPIGDIRQVGEFFDFHQRRSFFGFDSTAQFSDLAGLKKWISAQQ